MKFNKLTHEDLENLAAMIAYRQGEIWDSLKTTKLHGALFHLHNDAVSPEDSFFEKFVNTLLHVVCNNLGFKPVRFDVNTKTRRIIKGDLVPLIGLLKALESLGLEEIEPVYLEAVQDIIKHLERLLNNNYPA